MLPSLKLTANAPEKNGLLPQKEKFLVFHPIHFCSLRSVSFRDAVVASREPSLKLTAKAPENGWLEDFLVSFWGVSAYFQGQT